MVFELELETRRSVLPIYRVYQDGITRDAESWFTQLKAKASSLVRIASAMANQILRLDAEKHTDQFIAGAKKALGVDLAAVVRNEDLEEIMMDYAQRNANLIKSLADNYIGKVEEMTYAAKLAGTSHSGLSKKLTELTGAMKSRADLIAYDQLSKLNGQLNQTRQEQAGITEYTWLTSRDERVRPLHKRLDGTKYTWGKPTEAEEGLPPGQPIRCRCVAVAEIIF